MKILVAGSRSLTDWAVIRKFVDDLLVKFPQATEYVSGGAPGVDSMSAYLLKKAGKEVRVFKAEWDRLGKKAGFVRNAEMATWADIGVVLWDGASKGTAHTISELKKRGKAVYVRKVAPTVPAMKYRQTRTGPRPIPEGLSAPVLEMPAPKIPVGKANLVFSCWCGYCTKIEIMGQASCVWCQQKIDILSDYEKDIEWLRHRAFVREAHQFDEATPNPYDMGWPEEPISEKLMSAHGWL